MSLPDAGERVPLSCPTCSPDEPTVHEVLKPGGHSTVRCTECSHVHKEKVPDDETAAKVVVSQDGDSFTAEVDVPADAELPSARSSSSRPRSGCDCAHYQP